MALVNILTFGLMFLGTVCLTKQDTVTKAAARSGRADVRLNRFIQQSTEKGGEPSLRPAGRNFSAPTDLSLALYLVQIVEFNEKSGALQVVGWIHETWKDGNIAWSPPRFGGLKSIPLPPDRFWVPDIKLYNSRTGKTDFDTSANVLVKNDGTIFWVPPIKMDTTCLDHKNGTWTCQWKLGSWTYNGHDLPLKDSPTIDLSLLKKPYTNGWTAYDPKAELKSKVYSCCPESYQHILFEISLKKE